MLLRLTVFGVEVLTVELFGLAPVGDQAPDDGALAWHSEILEPS